jgi:CheY-like chemotaxis protein
MTKTLLLADDSVTMQKVVGITFANEDVHLVTVDNGDAALERALEVRPDVVLADVGMPGLNGYELCGAIKAEPSLRNVKVILLTGTFDTYDETRAREVGADAHVSKPFEAQALVDQVHALLSAPPARPTAPPPAATPQRAAPRLPDLSELEPPPLDFDPLSMDDDAPGGVGGALDTDVEDFPARSPRAGDPTRPASPDELPDLYGGGASKTMLLGADDMLDPLPPAPRSTPAPAARPAPAPAPKPAAPPRAAAPPPPPPPQRAPAAPRPSAEANQKTTLMPPPAALGEDLFPADVELFGPEPQGFGTSDAESSGVFGEPDEVEAAPPLPRGGPAAAPQRAALFGETLLKDFPSLDDAGDDARETDEVPAPASARPAAAARPAPAPAPARRPPPPPLPELDEDDGEEELELSSVEEEIPWAEPLETDEPATPNYFREPVTPPPLTPPRRPEPPAPRAPQAAPVPAPARPAARPSAPAPAPAVVLDPDVVNDAIEKLAWEAFGPLAETIVREVVKQVETIAWETIPQIAERLVQEEIARLKKDEE